MKNILSTIFLLSIVLSIESCGQNNEIVVDTEEFDFLRGMEYTVAHELGDFQQGGRTSINYSPDSIFGTTRLSTADYYIIVSERSTINSGITGAREILDLIVLRESVGSCSGCLKSKKQETRIMTIHSSGSKLSRESIVGAFLIDLATGRFKKVNPNKYKWIESDLD